MSGLKHLVSFLLVSMVFSQENNLQQPYSYPGYGYPASQQNNQQQPHTYSYPGYAYPHLTPENHQSYPWGVMQPSYGVPPYGQVVPSYPSYPSYATYPSYPSYQPHPYPYPYQPAYPNYYDPFAHIPTEIIDVDEGWENGIEDFSKVQTSSSQQSASYSQPPVQSHVVESKPFQATITRTFDADSSDPVVDVKYSNTDSNPGSGIVIDADVNGNAVKPEVSEIKEDSDNSKAKKEEPKDSVFGNLWG